MCRVSRTLWSVMSTPSPCSRNWPTTDCKSATAIVEGTQIETVVVNSDVAQVNVFGEIRPFTKVDIAIAENEVSVRDYGRGIPLGKVVECVSKINTGAKYNDDVFQFSVGLNGIGTKAVNALSSNFMVCSHREGKYSQAKFKFGKLIKQKKGKTDQPNGTFVNFVPDPDIFPKYQFCEEHIERRLRFYTYLNAGLRINYNDRRFLSTGGILDLI